jgi:hypothetical protein
MQKQETPDTKVTMMMISNPEENKVNKLAKSPQKLMPPLAMFYFQFRDQ